MGLFSGDITAAEKAAKDVVDYAAAQFKTAMLEVVAQVNADAQEREAQILQGIAAIADKPRVLTLGPVAEKEPGK